MTNEQDASLRTNGLTLIRTLVGDGPGLRHLLVRQPDGEIRIMDIHGGLHEYVEPTTLAGSTIVRLAPEDLPPA